MWALVGTNHTQTPAPAPFASVALCTAQLAMEHLSTPTIQAMHTADTF
jgi:hypothetical protein